MFESRRRFMRHTAAIALLVAGVAAVATSLAQSSNGKWWPGYGNGADNSGRWITAKWQSLRHLGAVNRPVW